MNKTLHQKLTNKYQYAQLSNSGILNSGNLCANVKGEMQLAHELSNDMLSPRPEAISRILKMSRTL